MGGLDGRREGRCYFVQMSDFSVGLDTHRGVSDWIQSKRDEVVAERRISETVGGGGEARCQTLSRLSTSDSLVEEISEATRFRDSGRMPSGNDKRIGNADEH